jgi:hypothetical protein
VKALGVAVLGGLLLGAASRGVPGGTALLLGLLAIAALTLGGRRAVTGTGHAHGGSRARVARHEAGHAVVVEALGGRVTSAHVSDGGWLSGPTGHVDWRFSGGTDKQLAEKHIAALLGGQLAAGRTGGCWADDAQIRKILRDVPEADRAAAERRARQIVSSRRTEIRRRADELADDR